jgi:CheY-like chemotaxis protein
MPGINNEYIPLQQLELPELLNIMLVEDRTDSVEVISDFLKSFGYTPTVFEHSTDALSAFETESDRFDILLTDYALPEMNGIELARAFKKIKPGFPVILFSGNIQENPSSPYIERFIAKPFSPMELKNLMLDVIRTRN